MTQEALKELLEAVEAAIQAGDWKVDGACDPDLVIRRAKEALAQPEDPCKGANYSQASEQEPVAWLLTDKNINSLQVNSIQRLIDRLKHAHHTDIRVRINGHDEWFEADWLKHMVRVAPPQRKPLTEPELHAINPTWPAPGQEWGYEEVLAFARAIEAAHGIKE